MTTPQDRLVYLDDETAASVLADYAAYVLMRGSGREAGRVLRPLAEEVVALLAASGYRLVALPDEPTAEGDVQ